jgi:hypothetical protein
MRAQYVHVSTRQSDSIDTFSLQESHDVLINKSAINHCHHLKHGSISHTAAANHLAFDAELRCHLCRTASSAMHENLRTLNVFEVVDELSELRFVLDYCASYLYYCYIHVVFFLLYCLSNSAVCITLPSAWRVLLLLERVSELRYAADGYSPSTSFVFSMLS